MELNDPGLFRQQGYIGGAWVDAEDGATFEVTDPADGAPLGTVPKMGAPCRLFSSSIWALCHYLLLSNWSFQKQPLVF